MGMPDSVPPVAPKANTGTAEKCRPGSAIRTQRVLRAAHMDRIRMSPERFHEEVLRILNEE